MQASHCAVERVRDRVTPECRPRIAMKWSHRYLAVRPCISYTPPMHSIYLAVRPGLGKGLGYGTGRAAHHWIGVREGQGEGEDTGKGEGQGRARG